MRQLGSNDGAALSSFMLATIVACGGSTFTSGDDGGGGATGDGGGSSDGGGSVDGGHGSDGGGSGDGGGGSDATHLDGGGRVPANHRPDDSQCSQPAPAGHCQLQQAQCTNDGQCTSGTNGRCIQSSGGALTCLCTYDTCVHDTDCGSGKLCVCHGSAFTGGAGNTCTAGNCRVDSDCGAGGYCSPSHGTSGCGGVTGYYCHSPADTCIDDSDCSGGGINVCAWSANDNHWKCQQQLLCP